ncbi:MAG: M20/M25/M40 family metallo-hydrolase, partial [Planctomycetales bacterium]
SGEERLVSESISDQLRRAGAKSSAIQTDCAHRRTPLAGQVGNLVFRMPGTLRGPRRMLMAHMDTVPICVGAQPVLDKGRIRSRDPNTGLGADDRAGVAVILNTAIELLRRRITHPPLTFFWTVQEEVGLQGVRYASLGQLGKPQLAFNFDGGSPEKLTVGATGGYRMVIRIKGLASHAGNQPEHGISAIAIAGLAIADLQENGWHGAIEKGRRRGTSNIGVIHGGSATNVVTDHVEIHAEARSHSPAFRKRIVREIEQAFVQAGKSVTNVFGVCGSVHIDGRLDYEAFRLSARQPCVRIAEATVRSVGGRPFRCISDGGLDANWLTARGIPTVTLGCGQLFQHTCKERLDIPMFHQACQIALQLASGYGQN